MADVSGVASVIQREHDAVAAETKIGQCPPLVATNDMENAAHLPSRLRSQHETKVKPLANAEGDAYGVDCPTLKSTVLWVATNNDSYRAEYLTFLNATYGLGLSSIPKPYDVDHLYNQTRAKGYGLKYLRLALVGYTPNRSHGAAYEKDLTSAFSHHFATTRARARLPLMLRSPPRNWASILSKYERASSFCGGKHRLRGRASNEALSAGCSGFLVAMICERFRLYAEV
jgi:hypothetical protein